MFQFGVAIYGGYFGAGIGILMLASLGFMGLSHIHEMNTLKTILASLINLVAALVFISNLSILLSSSSMQLTNSSTVTPIGPPIFPSSMLSIVNPPIPQLSSALS